MKWSREIAIPKITNMNKFYWFFMCWVCAVRRFRWSEKNALLLVDDLWQHLQVLYKKCADFRSHSQNVYEIFVVSKYVWHLHKFYAPSDTNNKVNQSSFCQMTKLINFVGILYISFAYQIRIPEFICHSLFT